MSTDEERAASNGTATPSSSPSSPGSIRQRRGQTNLDCCVRSQVFGDELVDSSSPTPSPPLLQRRQGGASARLTLNCSAICKEERWTPGPETEEAMRFCLDEYEVMEILGQGSMGVVRRGRRLCDGQEVSLKVVRTSDPELFMTTSREFKLLKGLQHPHIIKGHDCLPQPTCIVLVLEYFPGTTLQDAVRTVPGRRIPEDKARSLFMALISAIAYLHEDGIVHRDVKTENVLVLGDLSDLRLIDFNTAQRVADGGALSMTGTRAWAAPEVLRGESPGYPHDVWGAGLCLFVMLFGRLPRVKGRCRSAEEYAAAIVGAIDVAKVSERPELLSKPCRETLWSCLAEDVTCRPTALAVDQESYWRTAGPGRPAVRAC